MSGSGRHRCLNFCSVPLHLASSPQSRCPPSWGSRLECWGIVRVLEVTSRCISISSRPGLGSGQRGLGTYQDKLSRTGSMEQSLNCSHDCHTLSPLHRGIHMHVLSAAQPQPPAPLGACSRWRAEWRPRVWTPMAFSSPSTPPPLACHPLVPLPRSPSSLSSYRQVGCHPETPIAVLSHSQRIE